MSIFAKKFQWLSAFTLCTAILGSFSASAVWDGAEVKSGEWKGVVQTHFGDSESSCSATIVHPHLMITAAHCYKGTRFPRTMKVIFNHKTMSRSVTISEMKKHREYNDIYERNLPKGASESERVARFKIGQFDVMWIKTVEDLTTLGGEVYETAKSFEEISGDLGTKAAYAVGFGGSQHDRAKNRQTRTGIQNQASKRMNQLSPVSFGYASKYGVYQVNGAGVCSGDSGSGLYVNEGKNIKTVGVLSAVATEAMTKEELKAFKKELKEENKGMNPEGCDRNRRGVALYVPISVHLCWIQQDSGINLNAKCN